MSKPRIPFRFWPWSWGMNGKVRGRAQAEYELQGEELERKLANIDLVDSELSQKLLDIDFKYDHITEVEYEVKTIELMPDSIEKKIKSFDNLWSYGHITDSEYRKEIATLHEEPFFEFEVELVEGELELAVEYNPFFINHLRANGYSDELESDIIDQYVEDLGRRISQTDDEQLLDVNNELNKQVIKTEREGDSVSYK